MATRALLHVPKPLRRGEVFEVRATVQHAMETGYRRGSDGQMLARDIVRRIEARYDGALVFAADLYPAIAANPFVAFSLVATSSAPLELTWRGDNGFVHTERVDLVVGA